MIGRSRLPGSPVEPCREYRRATVAIVYLIEDK
jgi:hypothetical protein